MPDDTARRLAALLKAWRRDVDGEPTPDWMTDHKGQGR